MLYWNAVALGLAISVSKNEASMLARLPEVEALMDRALELDETWGEGALHEFAVTFAAAKPGKVDFPLIDKHFQRALELSRGRRAGLFVSYAEAVAVPRQDRALYQSMLEKALAINPDEFEASRLQNLAARERARWLLEQVDERILSLEGSGEQKQ